MDILQEGEGVSAEGRARTVAERITTRYLTKYERARVLGTRALQIRCACVRGKGALVHWPVATTTLQPGSRHSFVSRTALLWAACMRRRTLGACACRCAHLLAARVFAGAAAAMLPRAA
jgi:hypothetical protein